MSELRYNPVLREWIITATHRQERPLLPKKPGSCPFCVGAEEVPEPYEMVVLPNRFPSLHINPPAPEIESDEFYRVEEAKGICEVVLYSPEHNSTLSQQSIPHIAKLVSLLTERYKELGSKDYVKYVLFFENKGEIIGVTMHHPHGQIYAFPFIPPIIERELTSSREFFEKNKKCLHCEIIRKERSFKKRIVYENEIFVSFIPFYARWPYEVHIYPKQHLLSFLDFQDKEREKLAEVLKIVLVKYDNLFSFSFPYMMIIHQKPTDNNDYSYYHFHIEFYPPHRSKDKIKYLAGCESGAGTFINDTLAEEKAEELKNTPPFSPEDL